MEAGRAPPRATEPPEPGEGHQRVSRALPTPSHWEPQEDKGLVPTPLLGPRRGQLLAEVGGGRTLLSAPWGHRARGPPCTGQLSASVRREGRGVSTQHKRSLRFRGGADLPSPQGGSPLSPRAAQPTATRLRQAAVYFLKIPEAGS